MDVPQPARVDADNRSGSEVNWLDERGCFAVFALRWMSA